MHLFPTTEIRGSVVMFRLEKLEPASCFVRLLFGKGVIVRNLYAQCYEAISNTAPGNNRH
jgi:hypothetical protein